MGGVAGSLLLQFRSVSLDDDRGLSVIDLFLDLTQVRHRSPFSVP
jgi:hypothetical protein